MTIPFLIQFITLLVGVLLYYFSHLVPYNNQMLLIILVLVGVTTVSVLFKRERVIELRGNYFKAFYLFLLGYLIVHFQFYIDVLLKNITLYDKWIFAHPGVILKAASLSLVGLTSFYLGYLLYQNKKRTPLRNVEKKQYPLIFMVILLYPLTIWFFKSVGLSYILGGYGHEAIAGSSAGSYSQLLLKTVFFAVMILNYSNLRTSGLKYTPLQYFKSYGILFYIPLAAYLTMVLLSGDRGPLIELGLGYLVTYTFVAQKKISLKSTLIMLLCAAFLITILGIARKISSDGLSFQAKIEKALQSDNSHLRHSFSPNTVELATSVRTLHHSIKYVPEQHHYLMGEFQLKYIISSIPFLSGLLTPLFSSHEKYLGSAFFVTWIMQGDHPTYGEGTSCVTDLYLDFGILGVIIGLFFFGRLMRWTEYRLYVDPENNSVWTYILSFYLIVTSFYISRSAILYCLNPVVILTLIILAYKFIFKKNINL